MRPAHRGVRAAPRGRARPDPLSPPPPLLVLWDIDGTLLQRASHEHAEALLEAVAEVHGVDVRGRSVDAAGRTDASIARALLEAAGVGTEAIDGGAEAVRERTGADYAPPDLTAKVTPGVVAVLDALAARPAGFRSSLLTGNFEQVARRKLAAAGLGDYFAAGQGAFGSDAEAREALPAVARERAGRAEGGPPWPRERTVVVGDTPRDIACARADGVGVIAVTTGPYEADALTGADAVASDGPALLAALEAIADGGAGG